MLCTSFLCSKLCLGKSFKFDLCLVEVILDQYEPKLNSHDSFYCKPPITDFIEMSLVILEMKQEDRQT